MPDDKKEKETLTESSTDKTTDIDQLIEGGEKKTELAEEVRDKSAEETTWGSLSGNSQQRFKELINRAKTLEDKIKEKDSQLNQIAVVQQDYQRVQSQPTNVAEDEIQKAVVTLRKHGVATIDDLNGIFEQWNREKEHDNLSVRYNGTDGLPKYDKTEVEDYMRSHNIWKPEAAFRDMYFDEFMDAERRGTRQKKIVTEKPSSPATKEEPLTTESLREQLAGPKGREIYEKLLKNPTRFDEIVRQLSKA
mgnify:CR=1 FL=1